MEPKILYILPSYNLFGGTPKKTLDLMKYFGGKSALYIYENAHSEFKENFMETGGNIFEGFFGRNIIQHVRMVIRIIDTEKINVIQTQFSMGELIAFWVKLLRPKVKIIVAFVGAVEPAGIKSKIAKVLYKKVDHFVYISQYVQREKLCQFPSLKGKAGSIIYNGTAKREVTGENFNWLSTKKVLAISGLIELKNIQVLIDAFDTIVYKMGIRNISLNVAGDGPYREILQQKIDTHRLNDYVQLIGYQKNVGDLLESCDVFVHPSFNEGFGIVVAEGMLSGKPIVVSSAGALPELIDNETTGLVLDPHDSDSWAEAILRMVVDREFSEKLAKAALNKAHTDFSVDRFCRDYDKLYHNLLAK